MKCIFKMLNVQCAMHIVHCKREYIMWNLHKYIMYINSMKFTYTMWNLQCTSSVHLALKVNSG